MIDRDVVWIGKRNDDGTSGERSKQCSSWVGKTGCI